MLTLRIAILTTLAVTSTATQCYYPDGSNADNDVPCTSDVNTWCCGQESICLTNGYCINVVDEPWTMSAGSCTDATWDVDSCASECIDNQNDEPRSGGQSIVFFNATATGKYEYCCGQVVNSNDSVACFIGSPFELDSASMIAGRAALANYTDTANATTTTSSSTASSTSTSTSSSCPSTTTTPSTGSSSDNLAIGAGVGIPLGLVAVASLTWAFWERRQRKRVSPMMMPAVASIEPGWAPINAAPASELGIEQSSELGVGSPMAELSGYRDEARSK